MTDMPHPTNTVVRRGRRMYGVDIGVILMDSDAPRPIGDVGNARTFDFPIAYTTATGADARTVVERNAEGLLDTFVDSGRDLLDRGARALSTSCGFTAIHQEAMADQLDAIVATSSLLQTPIVLRMLAQHRHLGVITANASTLTDEHLRTVGISDADRKRLHLIGFENTEHLYQVLIANVGDLDTARATDEITGLATKALTENPEIGGFILECVNLPPYAPALRHHTGLPVWDITTLLTWIQRGLG